MHRKIRKALAVMLAVTLALIPTAALAAEAGGEFSSLGDNTGLSWAFDSGTRTLTIAYDENSNGSGVMPDYSETSRPWYSHITDIDALVIEEGIKHIGDYAFYDLQALSGMLIIPEGVTSIGQYAFAHCSSLISVTIPNEVTSIGTYAFDSCANTEAITFEALSPDTITTLESSSFGSLKSVGTVYYPEGVILEDYEDFLTKLKSSAGMPSGWTLAAAATTYTISYDAGSGNGNMEDSVATDGVAFTLPDCSFTAPDGQEFKAWEIDGTEYAVGDTCTFTADTTVTAVWTPITYTISYVGGSGSGSMAPGKATAGVAFTLPACTFTAPAGQEFKAWVIDGSEYAAGASYTFTANTTVTAAWKDKAAAPATYTVSYAAGGGSGSMASGKATAGVAFTLPACTFTAPAGKEFKAWKIGGNEYAAGASYTFTANTTVTAVWKNKTTYTVTYAGGSGSGSMAQQAWLLPCRPVPSPRPLARSSRRGRLAATNTPPAQAIPSPPTPPLRQCGKIRPQQPTP